MADHHWPVWYPPATSSFTWKSNDAEFRSPLAGTTRTESRPGGRWLLSMTYANMKNDWEFNSKIHAIEAAVFSLDGKRHRAILPDPAYKRAGLGNAGAVTVDGAGQTGLVLATKGWTTSGFVLFPGDRIGVSGQILVVTQTVVHNAGKATIRLAHPIRTAPADGSLVEIDSPVARFILQNDAGSSARPGVFKTVHLEFEEDIT